MESAYIHSQARGLGKVHVDSTRLSGSTMHASMHSQAGAQGQVVYGASSYFTRSP